MLRTGLLSLWDEPSAPNPPRRVWRDWLLVGAFMLSAVLEGVLRPDVTWRPVALALCLVLVLSLLWRRTHPLAVTIVVFGSITVVDLAAPYSAAAPFGLFTMAFVLLLPYVLGRWGSGRALVIGMAFTLGTHALREIVHVNFVDLLIGIPFLLAPALLGLAVRWRITARLREGDQMRLREREQLARELHDTVAHHVSAIVIQAQAGSVLADSRPEAAVEALGVIEAEAARALTEMREMVGALRDRGSAELVPQRGVADIGTLAGAVGEAPFVNVDVLDDVGTLRPSVDAAVYRIVQESITNAVRHARHATRIDVRVAGEDDRVLVTVVDDGDPTSVGRAPAGYGIVGMNERAALLGGTLEAGPRPGRGWSVAAMLPRKGASR